MSLLTLGGIVIKSIYSPENTVLDMAIFKFSKGFGALRLLRTVKGKKIVWRLEIKVLTPNFTGFPMAVACWNVLELESHLNACLLPSFNSLWAPVNPA